MQFHVEEDSSSYYGIEYHHPDIKISLLFAPQKSMFVSALTTISSPFLVWGFPCHCSFSRMPPKYYQSLFQPLLPRFQSVCLLPSQFVESFQIFLHLTNFPSQHILYLSTVYFNGDPESKILCFDIFQIQTSRKDLNECE